ncbi:Hypothetical protein NTJ_01261 [Nesidiocoris tenuis]|uniref:Uncharacterized protein n=1 Tax=Nesidiocoris tenuis TaxID=355587 RepID=A0ABN7ACA0_9HEMI|nr:Hypothetical protein NTJ_01261 [Nesidiocoris tenuis]
MRMIPFMASKTRKWTRVSIPWSKLNDCRKMTATFSSGMRGKPRKKPANEKPSPRSGNFSLAASLEKWSLAWEIDRNGPGKPLPKQLT